MLCSYREPTRTARLGHQHYVYVLGVQSILPRLVVGDVVWFSASQPVGRGPLVGRESPSGGPRNFPRKYFLNKVIG